MKKKKTPVTELPSIEQLRTELHREQHSDLSFVVIDGTFIIKDFISMLNL